jgi:hypothetical protein
MNTAITITITITLHCTALIDLVIALEAQAENPTRN